MEYQFPLFTIAYGIAAVATIIMAAVVMWRRVNPGSTTFAILLISIFIWSLTSVFEAGALEVEGKYLWSKWQYVGIVSVAPLWLLFTAEFSHQSRLLKGGTRHLIWVIPLVTLIMAFTNEVHHLLWSDIFILPDYQNHVAIYDHGPWFPIHILYSYLLLLIGSIWLMRTFFKFPKSQRMQVILVLTLLIVGWGSNIIYVMGLSPIEGLDLTPLSFAFIAMVLAWAIFRFRLFDLVPIAREMMLESMMDGVIVIDPQDIILDINQAAMDIVRHEGDPLIGKTIWEAFAKYAEVVEGLRNQSDIRTEIILPEEPARYLDLSITSVIGNDGVQSGQIILVRDITQRKLIEIEESDQRRFAEALADTAAAINSSLDLDEVLDQILDNVGKVVPHDAANIAMLDKWGVARFVKTRGYEVYGTDHYVRSIEVDVKAVPNLRKMAETGEACFNPDTHHDPDWDWSIQGSDWIYSYLGAPIISMGKLLGFIGLDGGKPNFFKPEQAERLQAFANQAAVAIRNAQLFKETVKHADEMATLYEVGLAVTSGLGLEQTVKSLYAQLMRVVPIDMFYLALYVEETGMLDFYIYDTKGRRIKQDSFVITERSSITRYVVEQERTVYIPDVLSPGSEFPNEKMVKIKGFNERAYLGIPLILRNRVLGVVALLSVKPDAYDANQIKLIETIAYQASIAMDNAQLFEKVQQMAITDSLTGLYNRRYFFAIAANEVERSRRYKKDLSLIMMDIDYFKTLNDTHGHLVGDQLLKLITGRCVALLRKVDIMVRYGGEEFVILLPETSTEEAQKAANRICREVADVMLVTDEGAVSVTVSIGVAGLTTEQDSLEALIAAADKALYAAKEAGRNCVKMYANLQINGNHH